MSGQLAGERSADDGSDDADSAMGGLAFLSVMGGMVRRDGDGVNSSIEMLAKTMTVPSAWSLTHRASCIVGANRCASWV